MRHVLFLNASTRESGVVGNTERLARHAAEALGPEVDQTWIRLADAPLPAFVDLRHSSGVFPQPEGAAATLLDATMRATDLVFVSPVYWFSPPAHLKQYLDQWSAWMRLPGVDFKGAMAAKRLWVIATSGDRAKAEPMLEAYRLCAEFMHMTWQGALWGKGGAPDAVLADATAMAAARTFLRG